MKFAIALLLAVVKAGDDEPAKAPAESPNEMQVWKLRSVTGTQNWAGDMVGFEDAEAASANEHWIDYTKVQVSSSETSEEDVMLGDDTESDHSKEFYNAWDAVKDEEEGYHRAMPSYFAGDDDDLFMRSMIKTYALEGKNKDGSPNGSFVMDEATTRAASSEVLGTHKGMKGDALKKYLDTYFPRTFAHFDVTKGGKIEVIKMPQFMRFLASDQYTSLLP